MNIKVKYVFINKLYLHIYIIKINIKSNQLINYKTYTIIFFLSTTKKITT